MRARLALTAALLACPALAHADDTAEDRLRAALKQSVIGMRAAQDQAAQLQSQLAQAQSDLAAAKAKYDADETKIAALGGNPKPGDLKALQAQIDAAKAENGALREGLNKYQSAIGQAQEIARAKDSESRQAQAGLKANTQALQTCKTANSKLIDVAEQVLHLYQDRSFLWVLRNSYEPLVGASKVDLQNIVQDYDDKIRDQEYVPPPAPRK